MDQQVHVVTLATTDLGAVRTFYRDGLNWTPLLDVPDEIIFFRIGHGLVLAFFDEQKFREDVHGAVTDTGTGGITLAHNVASETTVDEVVESAVRAGATLVKSPQRAAFGGYHGHIADPNGVLWEICYNPGLRVDENGRVLLTQVS